MTPEQLKLLRERLAAGRQPEHKLVDTRAFLRDWNEALAYAEKCLKEVLEAGADGRR